MATAGHEPTLLEDEDREAARRAAEQLQVFLGSTCADELILQLTWGDDEVQVAVPPVAVRVLADALTELGRGNAVSILSIEDELTTQQAADLLNVSRPYLIKLLQQGSIPFRRVGNRRRIATRDLLRYKQVDEERTRQALDELTKEAEKLGLDY